MKGDVVENEELIERSNKITNYKVAIPVVKEYETIISSKKKGILNVAYRQGLLVIKFKNPTGLWKCFRRFKLVSYSS